MNTFAVMSLNEATKHFAIPLEKILQLAASGELVIFIKMIGKKWGCRELYMLSKRSSNRTTLSFSPSEQPALIPPISDTSPQYYRQFLSWEESQSDQRRFQPLRVSTDPDEDKRLYEKWLADRNKNNQADLIVLEKGNITYSALRNPIIGPQQVAPHVFEEYLMGNEWPRIELIIKSLAEFADEDSDLILKPLQLITLKQALSNDWLLVRNEELEELLGKPGIQGKALPQLTALSRKKSKTTNVRNSSRPNSLKCRQIWQQLANEIWEKNPSKSKSDVVKQLIKKLEVSNPGALRAEKTIYPHVNKPDSVDAEKS